MSIDTILQSYKIINLIGSGGQKKVYLAEKNNNKVVLKLGKFSSINSLERIRREVEFFKNTSSEYYPKHFDFEIDILNNKFIIVEEYIDGLTLDNLFENFNTEEKIIKLFYHLICGLELMWDRNIVHRDLKPQNIIIQKDNIPKIIDLGIARFLDMESLTKTYHSMGPCTRVYASPEQLTNKKDLINMRSDFYSLGIIILELFLGFHPFDPNKVNNKNSIWENILQNSFVDASTKNEVSEAFIKLTKKLLMPEPFNRFKNYNKLKEFLGENWKI